MRVVVKKYGGTSVKDLQCITSAADSIARGQASGETVVAVVSAMAGVTNQLVQWAGDINGGNSYSQEIDVVCSSGEQVTAGLLALALKARGVKARSWLGWQLPIVTTEEAGNADILSIGLEHVRQDLEMGIVPVIAGFQGITSRGHLTTLGRGGSDTTAVAIAAELRASSCQIFTDVQGVYRVDPAYIEDPYCYSDISYEDMLHLAEHGGRVLHAKAARLARDRKVPIQILSSFDPKGAGTWIRETATSATNIAQKPIFRWRVNSSHSKDLRQCLESAQVHLLHWKECDEEVSFLTWVEAYDKIAEFVPSSVIPEKRVLITFLGKSFVSQDDFSWDKKGVEQVISFPYARGFVVEEKNLPQVMASMYQSMVWLVSPESVSQQVAGI
jgi:aspartokinase